MKKDLSIVFRYIIEDFLKASELKLNRIKSFNISNEMNEQFKELYKTTFNLKSLTNKYIEKKEIYRL